MAQVIKYFDFMGRKFHFNIDGGKFKTVFGGILSIIQTLGFLALLAYYGKEIIVRQEPNTIVSNSMKRNFETYNVDSSTFNFAIRIENVNGDPVFDPAIFTYDF